MDFLRKQWKWIVGVGGGLSLLVGGMLWVGGRVPCDFSHHDSAIGTTCDASDPFGLSL